MRKLAPLTTMAMPPRKAKRNEEAAPLVIVIDSDSDTIVISSDSESEPTSEDDFPSHDKILHGSKAKGSSKRKARSSRDSVVIPPVDAVADALTSQRMTVYHEQATVYDAMISRTCLLTNQNKFYVIQLLRKKLYEEYFVWFRWGRIGDKEGAHALKCCGTDLLKAKNLFEDKFFKKTGNRWADREKFTQRPGKYHMVKRDYFKQEEYCSLETLLARAEQNNVKCQLQPNLQRLIRSILDVKTLEKRVVAMKFDSQKMPLGALNQEQIDAGYKALRQVENCIASKASLYEFMSAANEFYTHVPHRFSRRERPKLIKTDDQLQEKLELLQALEHIRRTVALYNSLLGSCTAHPYDRFYALLGCKIAAVSPEDSDRKIIELAIKSTHGETHKDFSMSVQDVFSVCRPSEEEQFTSKGNHKMLWHGSMASNFTGILSEGLCIAPPHVPQHGLMFGKGVYFADCASKSAYYCRTQTYKTKEGVLALCEVSLGAVSVQWHGNSSMTSPPQGKHSVKGQGHFTPDPKGNVVMSNGATLACGTLVENERVTCCLNYNEYVVYDTKQVKLKYLVKVEFHDRLV